MKKIILLLITVFFFIACNKPVGDCFVEAGKIDTSEFSVNFINIKVYGIFDIFLFNSDSSKIQIITNQTLLKNISVEQINDTVIITDKNTCYFVRDKSLKIRINIYTNKNNLFIQNYNASKYFTENQLILNTFVYTNYCYSSNLNLDLNTHSAFIKPWFGYGEVVVKGRTASLFVENERAALVDLKDFVSDYTKVINDGVTDIYVNTTKKLYATITSSGNIYYSGNPDTSLVKKGEGNLIHLD